jgi:endonuclease/exonuclease/phosphatase family metal-dependent hydrolase
MSYQAHFRLRALMLAWLLLLASCAHIHNYTDPSGPHFAGSFPSPPDSEPALRVVTFNIEHARHIDGAIALLQEDPDLRGADVLFLQEMDAPGTRRIAEALDLNYTYCPAIVNDSTDFGNAILSRWPIRDEKKVILPHHAHFVGSQRIAVAGTVDIEGTPVRLRRSHRAAGHGERSRTA